MKSYKNYYTTHMELFEKFDNLGYTSVEVLPDLKGKPWDDLALGYLHALRPSSIRVTKTGVKLDSRPWRVTVFTDDQNIIKSITQEVEVGLPDGVVHGSAFQLALTYGIDSEQVKWHQDATSYEYISDGLKNMGFETGYFKIDGNGKRVKFPK